MTTLLSKRRHITQRITPALSIQTLSVALFIFCSSGVSESCDSPQEGVCGLGNGARDTEGKVIVIKNISNGSKLERHSVTEAHVMWN